MAREPRFDAMDLAEKILIFKIFISFHFFIAKVSQDHDPVGTLKFPQKFPWRYRRR